jgi:uncharacterized protein YdhG (YjbR/CyaY superfamily)
MDVKMKYKTIDEYISKAPKDVRSLLEKIQEEILKRVPTAEPTISYNIPAFKSPKVFIYFAAFKKHIGVYPPVKSKALQKKLKSYMNEKGNLAFPLDEEIPIRAIGDVAFALWKQYQIRK